MVLAACVAVGSTLALVLHEAEDVRVVRHSTTEADEPGPSVAAVETRSPRPSLPGPLGARRMAADQDVSSEEARALLARGTSAERYLALRRLEKNGASDLIQVAEGLVRSAGTSQADRHLAINALGVLARARGGRAALERCAASGPTPEIRQAARTLLARSGSR